MNAMETIIGQVTAPGAALVAALPAPGNSFQIRDSKNAWLLDTFSIRQAVGGLRITSPLLHDSTVGIDKRMPSGISWTQLPVMQVLTPQDNLSVAIAGSAVAGDIEGSAMTIYYEDLAGISARFIGEPELMRRAEDIYEFRVTITPGVVGGWSGSVLITSVEDQIKANRDYAWVGCSALNQAAQWGVRMLSPDWGNLGIGMPLAEDVQQSSIYWPLLSRRFGMPCIPVFNGSQKSTITMDLAANENGIATTLSVQCALLKPMAQKVGRR